MRIDRSSIIVRSTKPVETMVGSEVVLMSLASGQCFGLGETGSEVWRRLAVPQSIQQLASSLSTEYDAPVGTIEEDVAELVEKLESLDLISVGIGA